MKLNSMKPGSRKAPKRLGRGHSAGQGKTCGRGQKGQHARSGGYHKVGFEGGQMPLQRRLPKIGFVSRTASDTDEIRLHELGLVDGDLVDLLTLKKAGLIGKHVTRVRVIKSGELGRAVTVKGLKVTAGARKAISDAGGTVED